MTWDELGHTERPGRDLRPLKLKFGAGTGDDLPWTKSKSGEHVQHPHSPTTSPSAKMFPLKKCTVPSSSAEPERFIILLPVR